MGWGRRRRLGLTTIIGAWAVTAGFATPAATPWFGTPTTTNLGSTVKGVAVGPINAEPRITASSSWLPPRTQVSRRRRAHAHGFSRQGLLSLPLAAQGPVSEAVGADSAAYRISRIQAGIIKATTPAQRLTSSFTSAGVSVSSGATRVGLRLRGVGYGSAQTALAPVAPKVQAQRVLYAHPSLREWYANGPVGLEQGFTIRRAPARRGGGPLTLSLAISGNAHPALAAGGQSITFSHAGRTVLRYAGLSASDATGRALRSWLALEGGRVMLHVDSGRARYPLRIDPFIQQGPKLTGAEESGTGEFGWSVALSSDGSTALIGGPADKAGAVWVFTRSGSTWTQQGPKLTGAEESGEGNFGSSVALSSDGNTALIGGWGDNESIGAAWVFTRSGSTWTQQGPKLTAGLGITARFGYGVALSSDGDTALIGSPVGGDNSSIGAAWVFTRSGSTWTQQGPKLTGGEESGEGGFGNSVALSSDGDTALIGGPYDHSGFGAAWVFTRSGSTWTQQGPKLTGGEEGRAFGWRVALSSDGETALIGSAGNAYVSGAAWVFTRSGSTWTQQGPKLTEEETYLADGGVALSSDGDTALIGSPDAAWVFTRSGSTWTQQGPKLTGAEESGTGEFGWSVALSSDGSTALIGGPDDQSGVGAAWVFAAGQLRLTTTLTGSGSGTVVGAGIHCPGACSHVYPEGTEVTLTATPEPGSTFLGWSGGGCGGTGTCTVTMDADKSVTAEFSSSSSTPPGNGPTPPPAPTCKDSSQTIGPFTIRAACFVSKGGKFVAKGRVRVNGVDIVPAGSGSITVDPHALTLSTSGEVDVYLGSIEVYHRSLNWKLQGSLTLELPAGVKAKGVPITGKLQLTPSAAKGGLMQVGANAEIGPITGSMRLELTNALGLQMQNARLSWKGGLPLKQLVVKSATLHYEHTSAGDEWSGEVAVELPAKLPELDGKLAILNGKIAEIGLAASKIDKPIGAIVYLQKIGLAVRVVPHITATGEIELSAGPKLPIVDAPAASLDGTLTADFGNPVVLSASGKVVVAGKLSLASGKAKWTVPSRFELSGEARISVGPASVDARVSGIVASSGFSLFGSGDVSIPGASGNGIVYFSEKGFGACFMESVGPVTVAEGFGAHWRLEFPSLWFDSCGLEDYKSKALASSSGVARSSAAGEVIQVPAGQEQVLIGARGVSDFPAIAVESPNGQLLDPANGVSGPVEGGGYRFVSDPPHLGTYVILAHPKSGAWRIIPKPDSPHIGSYGSALGAPPLGIKAQVQRKGGDYTLGWRATQIHGETIRFTEVSPTSTRVLRVTSKESGALRIKPADPYSGGRRTIEALISVDGLPRKIAKVTFQVRQRRLPKIRGLHVQRRRHGALVRWQPVRGVALDLWVHLSDGRRLFFRLPPGSRSQSVQLLPWTKRATVTINPIAASGKTGPRSRVSARL